MLTLVIPDQERWSDELNRFFYTKGATIQMEHNLVALAKWESKWHKPFISSESLTMTEYLDYLRCMTVTEGVDPNVFYNLTDENMRQIKEYMDDPMTATWFREEENNKGKSKKVITAEVIYGWMVGLEIPFECQYWHLNRLMTLIRVVNTNNQPEKKMSMRDRYSRNTALNAARRKKLGTHG